MIWMMQTKKQTYPSDNLLVIPNPPQNIHLNLFDILISYGDVLFRLCMLPYIFLFFYLISVHYPVLTVWICVSGCLYIMGPMSVNKWIVYIVRINTIGWLCRIHNLCGLTKSGTWPLSQFLQFQHFLRIYEFKKPIKHTIATFYRFEISDIPYNILHDIGIHILHNTCSQYYTNYMHPVPTLDI